ncbi:unnamed protein product [Cuscuta epithymum]|uniref:Cyclin C-terminal domain-containing protein n=1 Tax=Cuscuta epithymum TaxID=186058 RepID=A0AAV0GGJ4_9ASTE|nr:unnamed protein product [Cuscuta epithymum]CAH9146467.1 unnamed protein product [Cuscuta epithymum]
MQVLKYEIGVSCIAYVFLEDLIIQLKDVARVGEHVSYEACMDIMDLLYEMEETSVLFTTSKCLAASILAAAYVITVPVQRWEFPILPWVVFVTSCREQEVVNTVKVILSHVFEPGPRP